MRDTLQKFTAAVKAGRAWKAVLFVELLAVLLLLANCFRSRCDYIMDADDLYIQADYVEKITDENGTSSLTAVVEDSTGDDGEVILSSQNLTLYPGSYRVSVSYHSQVNYVETSGLENGLSYLNLESEHNSAYYDFPRLLLRDTLSSVEQTVQIRSPWVMTDYELNVSYYGYGELTVYAIEVEEIVAYRYVSLIGILLLFILLDTICFLVFCDQDFHYGKEVGILTLICVGAVLPFMANWTYWGHDIGFHANRIQLLATEIANGNWFPAVFSSALNGYGYPAPLFYGEIFLYIPALLYCCGLGLTTVYNLYVCMVSVATCLIMYACSRKIFQKTSTALLAAAMYTFSAVRLTNVFVRSAVGEYTAQVFLPLVFLGFYQVYSAPKGEKVTIRRYWPIIVGLTAIVNSHTLSIVMSAMLILLVCVALIKKTLEPQRLWGLIKAAVLSLLVNLAFLVPMAASLRMDMVVSEQAGGTIQQAGTYLLQVFQFVVNGYQLDQSSSPTPSEEMSLSLGLPVILGLVLFLVYLAKQNACGCRDKEKRNLAGACWVLSVFTIFLSSIYMFYDYLDFLPEQIYNVLVVYQFPWRWLTYAVLFGVFCTAVVVDSGEVDSLFRGISPALILAAALILNTGQIYADQLRTATITRLDNNAYRYTLMVGGDNLLWGSDVYEVYYSDLIYDETQVSAGDYRYEDGRWQLYDVENASDIAATVDIPLFHYDNYAAYDSETGEEIAISNGSNNRIQLNIPAGYNGTVIVEYQIPTLWKAAVAVSVATDALLVVYVILHRRKGTRMKLEEKQK